MAQANTNLRSLTLIDFPERVKLCDILRLLQGVGQSSPQTTAQRGQQARALMTNSLSAVKGPLVIRSKVDEILQICRFAWLLQYQLVGFDRSYDKPLASLRFGSCKPYKFVGSQQHLQQLCRIRSP
jgi:hypothetical protein